MPSPFPGMDPFIETWDWQSFHATMVPELGSQLVPQVRPKYGVNIARDVYLVRGQGSPDVREPDVAVVRDARAREPDARAPRAAAGGAVTLQPVARSVPVRRERRHLYIEVRDMASNEVVTVVELLSPTNRTDRTGRKKYIAKRDEMLESRINLVELDLMRRGRRLPMEPAMPDGDYFAVVCRASEVPRASVYAWALRDPLPAVPVPLAGSDADAVLNLQTAFAATYERLGLDYRLPYDRPVKPPVAAADARWLAETLASAGPTRE